MKPLDLTEVRPGEWEEPKPETYWQGLRRNWKLELAVHIPGLTLVLLLEHWLQHWLRG